MVESGFVLVCHVCRRDGGLSPIDAFIYMVAMVCARATHLPIPNKQACLLDYRRFHALTKG